MQRLIWLSAVLMLGTGCAASQAKPATSEAAAAAAREPDQVATLNDKLEEQQKRIAELESRLGLLEAEARRGRSSPQVQTETIRIGSHRREEDHDSARATADAAESATRDEERSDAEESAPRGRRESVPTLRLYGSSSAAAGESLSDLAQNAPALPVAPLPEERARTLAQGGSVDGDADAKEQYRSALHLLRERRYDEALAAFDTFITTHANHALAANALYWRGEAHYAKRDYKLAREAFDALLTRFAKSDKAADSLLKVGLCLRRMGDETQAKIYFRRVQTEFPNTQAAQLASREGST